MKNKIPKDSIFNKKGFYVALYSCIGVVMVMAGIVTYNNLTASPEQQVARAPESSAVEMEPTMQNGSTSYLDQSAAQVNSFDTDPQSIVRKPVVTAEPSKPPSSNEGVLPKPNASPVVTPVTTPVARPSSGARSDSEALPHDFPKEKAEVEKDATHVYSEFEGDSTLVWPVSGEIIMDYSDQHAIYDKTLNQYRTNDNICISADLGEQVLASAEGVVLDVGRTEENGNYVVMDHGNGWATTYSQLQDGVLVQEGDVVTEGQVIGGVSSPSIYSVLLGNHVAFKVTKDSVSVDPKTLLK